MKFELIWNGFNTDRLIWKDRSRLITPTRRLILRRKIFQEMKKHARDTKERNPVRVARRRAQFHDFLFPFAAFAVCREGKKGGWKGVEKG